MITSFKMLPMVFRPGLYFGLNTPTAFTQISVTGSLDDTQLARLKDRAPLDGLNPTEPLFEARGARWYVPFLVDAPLFPGRIDTSSTIAAITGALRPTAQDTDPSSAPSLAQAVVALYCCLTLWARDPVQNGQVLQDIAATDASPHRFNLALPYWRKELALDALKLSLQLVPLWAKGELHNPNPAVHAKIATFLMTHLDKGLPPNSVRFGTAAMARGHPIRVLPDHILQIGHGTAARKFWSTITDKSSSMAVSAARKKPQTNQMLRDALLPAPRSHVVKDLKGAMAAAKAIGWPVVVKPAALDQGLGVTANITTDAGLERAFRAAALPKNGGIIVESYLPGTDHRILVVNGRMMVATKRVPAGVRGDGHASIAQLVELANKDPRRGGHKRALFIKLALDEPALDMLARQNLTPEDVPAQGQFVALSSIANVSTGGTAEDVTDVIHPFNRAVAERAAAVMGLDIAGIDLICPDITRSIAQTGGGICEVNAQPGFRLHWQADLTRDINGEVIDLMFLNPGDSRIKTSAITGTNGKSTSCIMLDHILRASGLRCGASTTSGVTVNGFRYTHANLSGASGAQILLNEPDLDAAVFEMPRKGLVTLGHPDTQYDVCAMTNVTPDHLGEFGIETVADMAVHKGQVLARAKGAVVVNAEDPLCLAQLPVVSAPRVILTARDPATLPSDTVDGVRTKLKAGYDIARAAMQPAPVAGSLEATHHKGRFREAVLVQRIKGDDWLVHWRDGHDTALVAVTSILATENGTNEHNLLNAICAASMALAHGIDPEVIRVALGRFQSDLETNPARYNRISGFPYDFIFDFAHNPIGVVESVKYFKRMVPGNRHILVQTALGNRFPIHLDETLPHLKGQFAHIYLGPNNPRVLKNPIYTGENDAVQPGPNDPPVDPIARYLARVRQTVDELDMGSEMTLFDTDVAALRAGMNAARPGDAVLFLGEIPVLERVLASIPGYDPGL